MRVIYVDEAGISAREPRCVVAAVLVDPDTQYRSTLNSIKETFDRHVPEELRNGFHFHATEVFSGGKSIDRERWPLEKRLEFFKEFVSLPQRNGIPLAFSIIDKSWGIPFPHGVDAQLIYHGLAFEQCMERADSFLRKYLRGTEAGVVVCEDIPQHRKVLARLGLQLRDNPVFLPSESFRPEIGQRVLGMKPEAYELRIDHIIDAPHFVAKKAAPILQLADACAFAIRRWVNKESRGQELVKAMLGERTSNRMFRDPVWFEGPHAGLVNTDAFWSESENQQRQMQEIGIAVSEALRE